MIGHEPTLSETNTHGWIPLCQCGWIGGVVQMIGYDPAAPQRLSARVELVKAIALDAHAIHLHDVRADIARQSDVALAGIGRSIVAAKATLQRRGRWGRP